MSAKRCGRSWLYKVGTLLKTPARHSPFYKPDALCATWPKIGFFSFLSRADNSIKILSAKRPASIYIPFLWNWFTLVLLLLNWTFIFISITKFCSFSSHTSDTKVKFSGRLFVNLHSKPWLMRTRARMGPLHPLCVVRRNSKGTFKVKGTRHVHFVVFFFNLLDIKSSPVIISKFYTVRILPLCVQQL
jgi:hypothetical protein